MECHKGFWTLVIWFCYSHYHIVPARVPGARFNVLMQQPYFNVQGIEPSSLHDVTQEAAHTVFWNYNWAAKMPHEWLITKSDRMSFDVLYLFCGGLVLHPSDLHLRETRGFYKITGVFVDNAVQNSKKQRKSQIATCASRDFLRWFIEWMGVSKNRGTPKWMVYNGKPY